MGSAAPSSAIPTEEIPRAGKIAAVAGLNYDRLTALLRRKGANIDIRNKLKLTALHLSINQGNVVAIDALLQHGADIEASTGVGKRPLYLAVEGGNAEVVACLLRHNALLDADVKGLTALHEAALRGHTEILQLFIDKKADVNARCRLGDPLFLAVRSRKLDAVEVLLRADAEPNTFNLDLDPPTALHLASLYGDVEIIGMLLDAGAQIDLRDMEGATPLFRAVHHNHLIAAKLLLDRGANMRVWKAGKISLQDVAKGKKDMLDLLQKNKVIKGPKIGVDEEDEDDTEQPFTTLMPSPPPSPTERNKMVACQGFNALITDFYTSGGQEFMYQEKPSVYALLYSHGPGAYRSRMGDKTPDFTWYHLPANNVRRQMHLQVSQVHSVVETLTLLVSLRWCGLRSVSDRKPRFIHPNSVHIRHLSGE